MVDRRSPLSHLCALGTLAASVGLLAGPTQADARTPLVKESAESEPEPAERKRRIPYRALEVQGVVVGQLLPSPAFGVDAAAVIGSDTFQLRAGALVLGIPPFKLGTGKVGNTLAVATADMCVGKSVFRSQIRMCVGGQGGAMRHRWIGIEPEGRNLTPWWAGTIKSDYRHVITEKFGVMFGAGVVIPIVGPRFRGYNQLGSPGPLVLPGPVGGQLSVGTSWRF